MPAVRRPDRRNHVDSLVPVSGGDDVAKNEKTEFCKSLDWKFDVMWLDLTGMYRLDDDRVARIELATRGTCGKYEGFMVTVLNKREGRVDEKFFAFDDYLSSKMSDRSDQRGDYPRGDNPCFHVISSCGWGWYIAEPKSTVRFTVAVDLYLDMFR